MPSGMTKHENIAKTLKARLSELTTRVGEIDSELRKPLSADLEEQATDLENQEALEAIEDSEIHEIHQIREALKRISEGTYGICAPIAVKILTPNVWRRCRLRLDVFYALRENLSSALTCKDWCESGPPRRAG
jgi:RNA polymerase-binding transcription factor DksA